VLIEVVDTGPGISADDLPLIFEPYWSGRRGQNHRSSQSTGLGLFISKGIIEAHGGRLWAESEPGRGSTFRFTLPLVQQE
jgi:signal transduction histidine kinase